VDYFIRYGVASDDESEWRVDLTSSQLESRNRAVVV
jgi:hypothetical protein